MGKVEFRVDMMPTLYRGMDREMIIDNKQQKSSGWTPFDGMKVKGWPTHTIIRGNCVMSHDEVLGELIGQMIKFKETM